MQVFDAEAVRRRSPMPALVRALQRAFVAGAEVPQRHAHALPEGATLLLMPAWRSGPGARLGVKTVTVCPGNGALALPGVHGLFSLFDSRTGVPLAVLDGSELTARRTAAASALAASFLARADACRLLVVGAGRVATLMPEAMRAVRPGLREFRVWARRPEAAEALAAAWRARGFAAQAATDLEAAVRAADIVSCATLSAAPLVHGAWLAPGTHLDLIGSFTPTMRETDGECFARCQVWVDTAEALAKAGDVLQAIAEGRFAPERVQGTLADLCRHGRPIGAAAAAAAGLAGGAGPAMPPADPSTPADCTLFKSVGNAIEDLAAAELVVDGPG